ncbi:MAG: NUDIX domain-containing protein [Acidimicrobiia bacterium]
MGDAAGFARLTERALFEGRVFSLVAAAFRAPDGERFDRDLIRHPGAVAVVAVDDEGRAVLVRQYRPALDAVLLEIPAGIRDQEGEEPVATAQRELGEEVGLRAGRLELMTSFVTSPGCSDERCDIYLGRDLTEVPAAPVGAEERAMTVERVPLDDVVALVASGELTDSKTIIGLFLARERAGR